MDQKYLYNNKTLRERRRDLRNNATESEQLLWSYLKSSQLAGFKFVRQYSVGPYILDFYCPSLRLGIELDGSSHFAEEAKIYDENRSKYLKSVNIRVIRFWNGEVLKNVDKVLGRIGRNLTPPSS